MSSYRFCRTDDVPLLVEAYERCYRPFVPDAPEMTVERFRTAARELGLWCGNCMVAHEGREPIGVLLSAKSDVASLVLAVGVVPHQRRRGHGRHMLASLGSKLAILGPPRLVAEVPADRGDACRFFEACGFRRERTYADYERPAAGGPATGEPDLGELLAPIALDGLAEGDLAPDGERCWERSRRALAARAQPVRGLAVATDRIEAHVLHGRAAAGESEEIVGFFARDPARRREWLAPLLQSLCGVAARPLRVSKTWDGEVPRATLEAAGFVRSREYVGFAAEAAPP